MLAKQTRPQTKVVRMEQGKTSRSDAVLLELTRHEAVDLVAMLQGQPLTAEQVNGIKMKLRKLLTEDRSEIQPGDKEQGGQGS